MPDYEQIATIGTFGVMPLSEITFEAVLAAIAEDLGTELLE
jgi:hypothetical protein